jgi:hypothetical protein
MLRCVMFVLCALCFGVHARAATDEDRHSCVAEQNAELRIGACTRVLEDQGTVPALRATAFRDRGLAFSS